MACCDFKIKVVQEITMIINFFYYSVSIQYFIIQMVQQTHIHCLSTARQSMAGISSPKSVGIMP